MTDFETSSQLFSQAATLMLVGMCFVFAFLGILIVVIKVFIAPLAEKYPDKISTDRPSNKHPSTSQNINDQTVLAVISAAINSYRQKHQ